MFPSSNCKTLVNFRLRPLSIRRDWPNLLESYLCWAAFLKTATPRSNKEVRRINDTNSLSGSGALGESTRPKPQKRVRQHTIHGINRRTVLNDGLTQRGIVVAQKNDCQQAFTQMLIAIRHERNAKGWAVLDRSPLRRPIKLRKFHGRCRGSCLIISVSADRLDHDQKAFRFPQRLFPTRPAHRKRTLK